MSIEIVFFYSIEGFTFAVSAFKPLLCAKMLQSAVFVEINGDFNCEFVR